MRKKKKDPPESLKDLTPSLNSKLSDDQGPAVILCTVEIKHS